MDSDSVSGPASERFSARNGVTVRVDHDICVGFGECLLAAPEVFALNDESVALVIDPDAVDLNLLQAAADLCPVSAIVLLDGDPLAP